MSIKYSVGGCATVNGIIMINAASGRVARASRNTDGSLVVEDMTALGKAMALYKLRIEKKICRIPAVRELFNILLMFVIAVISMFSGFSKTFSFKKWWTAKKIISILLLASVLYGFVFLDSYLVLLAIPVLAVLFRREIVEMLMYHGAEHKCINMYENIEYMDEASIESARSFSRIHLRCGTNMILILLPFVLAYYLLTGLYPVPGVNEYILELMVTLVLLVLSMEVFKLLQKPSMRSMLKPGIFVQNHITTREPEDRHLEAALAALKAVVE